MKATSTVHHPDLLVGIDGMDDAGVYRISEAAALVQTVDFFTPIVDDARDWGRIAAANALSDIYAMGGTPLTALSIVGWPREQLPFELLGDVLEGGSDVLAQAQCTLLGGHSIDDPEPKYGLAVTGTVHPDRIVTNNGAKAGDVIVLTKPIGTGLIATAIKHDLAQDAWKAAALSVMTTLNASASSAMVEAGANAATDVTGFGLLGHLAEMVRVDGLGADIDLASVPVLPGAVQLAVDEVIPGGTIRNLEAVSPLTDFGQTAHVDRIVLADAQTSGGLLIAIDPGRADALVAELRGAGLEEAAAIGEFTGAGKTKMRVR